MRPPARKRKSGQGSCRHHPEVIAPEESPTENVTEESPTKNATEESPINDVKAGTDTLESPNITPSSTFIATLEPPPSINQFGSAVATLAGRVLIGAPTQSTDVQTSRAFVYKPDDNGQYDENQYVELAKENFNLGGMFGSAVAMSESAIFTSSIYSTTSGSAFCPGIVYKKLNTDIETKRFIKIWGKITAADSAADSGPSRLVVHCRPWVKNLSLVTLASTMTMERFICIRPATSLLWEMGHQMTDLAGLLLYPASV